MDRDGNPACRYCSGCGAPEAECAGNCRRELDPPRFCPECGRRAIAQVTPTGYRARCKRHGELSFV